MAYGFAFSNNQDVITLDSEYSRLVVLASGRYNPNGVLFPQAITSQEAPLIFVKPDDAVAVFKWCRILGGPGNWVGFGNGAGQNVGSGEYFLAAYASTPTDTYGMRLWDSSGKQLFDSGTPCAQFTTVVSSWQFDGSVNTSVGRWSFYLSQSAPINNGDFMMINNISMDLPCRDTFGKLSLSQNRNTNRVSVVLQNIGDFNGSSLFLPVLFAKKIS
ncbi:hypothetical protein ACQRBV_22485 [Pseudomonas sp. R11F]|uniref:hypothetical protein n=1 Tax=Pseudomonas TaxID=286 RepID=UPI00398F4DC3